MHLKKLKPPVQKHISLDHILIGNLFRDLDTRLDLMFSSTGIKEHHTGALKPGQLKEVRL